MSLRCDSVAQKKFTKLKWTKIKRFVVFPLSHSYNIINVIWIIEIQTSRLQWSTHCAYYTVLINIHQSKWNDCLFECWCNKDTSLACDKHSKLNINEWETHRSKHPNLCTLVRRKETTFVFYRVRSLDKSIVCYSYKIWVGRTA